MFWAISLPGSTRAFPQVPPILLLASGCWKLLYKTGTAFSLLCYARSKLLFLLMLVFELVVTRTDPGCRCLLPSPFRSVRLIRFCTFASKYHCCRLHPRLLKPLKETHRAEPLSVSQDLLVHSPQKDQCAWHESLHVINSCSCFLIHIWLLVKRNTCLLSSVWFLTKPVAPSGYIKGYRLSTTLLLQASVSPFSSNTHWPHKGHIPGLTSKITFFSRCCSCLS